MDANNGLLVLIILFCFSVMGVLFSPGGSGCEHGAMIDETELDNSFTCDCSNTRYKGDNCEILDSTEVIVGASLGGVAFVLLVLLGVYRRQTYLANNRAYDFKVFLSVWVHGTVLIKTI